MNESVLKVGAVMRPKFVMVDGMETIKEALEKLRNDNAQVLIVNKRHDDDEYGIVLLTNIVSDVLARNKAPDRVNVYEIMSKPAITVDPDMSVKNCARLFKNIGISAAPVIQNDEIVGIVSYRELAFGITD